MIISHPTLSMQEKIDQIHTATYAIASGIERLLNTQQGPDVYTDCSTCGCVIHYGNACVDVTRQVEQIEIVDGQRIAIVIDADVLATFCAGCGNRYANATSWRQNLASLLGMEEGKLAVARQHICDGCHCSLEGGGSWVAIDVMISQVDMNEDSHVDARHTPITSETILLFCPRCGNRMSRARIHEAVAEFLCQDEHGEAG